MNVTEKQISRETFNPFLANFLTCEIGNLVPGHPFLHLWRKETHIQSTIIVLMVTSWCTFAGLSGLWDAIRHHLGWVSRLVSCRDAVRCVRNFLSGWCNYGALDLVFSNKQILSAIERRVKCQSFQTSVEAGDCPVSLRTGCHLLLLPCHTDTAPWLGWLVAGNNWCRILIFSPAVPSTPKKLLFSPFDPSLLPSLPDRPCRPCTRGRRSPEHDALRLLKSTRLLSLRLGSFSGESCSRLLRVFYSTNNCMREAEKDLCGFIAFHHFAGLICSLPGASRWISFCLRHWGRIPSPSVDPFYFYGKCLPWMRCSAAVNGTLACSLSFQWCLVTFSLRFSRFGGSMSGELTKMPRVVCLDCLSFYFYFPPTNLSCSAVMET